MEKRADLLLICSPVGALLQSPLYIVNMTNLKTQDDLMHARTVAAESEVSLFVLRPCTVRLIHALPPFSLLPIFSASSKTTKDRDAWSYLRWDNLIYWLSSGNLTATACWCVPILGNRKNRRQTNSSHSPHALGAWQACFFVFEPGN